MAQAFFAAASANSSRAIHMLPRWPKLPKTKAVKARRSSNCRNRKGLEAITSEALSSFLKFCQLLRMWACPQNEASTTLSPQSRFFLETSHLRGTNRQLQLCLLPLQQSCCRLHLDLQPTPVSSPLAVSLVEQILVRVPSCFQAQCCRDPRRP